MREVVRGLVALGADIEVVYTSPLVRAAHTAEILAAGLSSRPDVTAMPQLAPGHPPASTADALAERPRVRSVALVGHEPGMGELAAWLLGTPEPPVFKKGGVCCLHTRWPPRPGTSELIWFATPKMLRSL